MREISSWKAAFDLFLKTDWLTLAVWSLVAGVWGGIVLALVVFLFLVITGSWRMKLKLICQNSYRGETCTCLVSRGDNYCRNCGNEVPEEFKPRSSSSR